MIGLARLAGHLSEPLIIRQRMEIPRPIEEIAIGSQRYNPTFFKQVYNTLSVPANSQFYESPNLRANVSNGVVEFERNLPVEGWSYQSPEEVLAAGVHLDGHTAPERQAILSAPPVDRDLLRASKTFRGLLNSSEGQGIYRNNPVGGLEGKRAKAYRAMGFEDVPSPLSERQVLDNRVVSNPDQQRLLMVGDQLYKTEKEVRAYMGSRQKRNLPIYDLPERVLINDMPLNQYLKTARQTEYDDLLDGIF